MSISPNERIHYEKEVNTVRRSITLNAPISRVWKALATSDGLASWLMPNNFQPVLGTHFTFRAEPQGNWNGIIECRVTEVDELRKLAFTWCEMPELPPTLVTFELRDLGGRTEVTLIHTGREQLPEDYVSLLDQGWGCNMLRGLAKIIEG